MITLLPLKAAENTQPTPKDRARLPALFNSPRPATTRNQSPAPLRRKLPEASTSLGESGRPPQGPQVPGTAARPGAHVARPPRAPAGPPHAGSRTRCSAATTRDVSPGAHRRLFDSARPSYDPCTRAKSVHGCSARPGAVGARRSAVTESPKRPVARSPGSAGAPRGEGRRGPPRVPPAAPQGLQPRPRPHTAATPQLRDSAALSYLRVAANAGFRQGRCPGNAVPPSGALPPIG